MAQRSPRIELGALVLKHDGDFWQGTLALDAFSDLLGPRRTKLLFSLPADGLPSATQQAGVRWLLARPESASLALRKALLASYPVQRRRFGNDVIMPETLTSENLAEHVFLRSVTFHDHVRGRTPYLGYTLGCSWDDEHGLGVMMHGTRSVEVGGADTAILGWIAGRDAEAKGEPERRTAPGKSPGAKARKR